MPAALRQRAGIAAEPEERRGRRTTDKPAKPPMKFHDSVSAEYIADDDREPHDVVAGPERRRGERQHPDRKQDVLQPPVHHS